MIAAEVVNIIRDSSDYAKQQGIEFVRICDLDSLLNDIDNLISNDSGQDGLAQKEMLLAHFKAEHESSLAHFRAIIDTKIEEFKSVITAGQSALRSAILINGGAAIALLSFIGHIWNTKPSPPVAKGLACSLLIFVLGVLAGSISTGLTYLSQASFGYEKYRIGIILNIFAIMIIILSYVCFIIGGYSAYNSFLSHF